MIIKPILCLRILQAFIQNYIYLNVLIIAITMIINEQTHSYVFAFCSHSMIITYVNSSNLTTRTCNIQCSSCVSAFRRHSFIYYYASSSYFTLYTCKNLCGLG